MIAASAAPDAMAHLITSAVNTPPPPKLAPKAAAPASEFWINVASYSDLSELEHARLSMVKFGDYRIVTSPSPNGAFIYALQSGPYPDEPSMEASLAALREAGYPAAAPADGVICASASPQTGIAAC